MEDVQESGKRIACHITNLSLVHKGLIEEIGRVLFLDFFLFLILAICLLGALVLLHCHSRDVKSHLDQLVRAGTGLPATVLCAARLVAGTICLSIKGKFHSNFILSGKVGIQNLGIRKLEGRSVLDVEGQLGLGEIRLSPVPSPESMFAGLHVDAVPDLEGLAQSLEVLRREKIKSGIALSLRRITIKPHTSWSKPSNWMIPEERESILSSNPLAARLHWAEEILLLSRVKVSPPPEGRHPKPLSASLHFPGCFERSR